MLNLARAIFGVRSESERAHDQLVKLATDRLVQGTDSRLVAVSGYEKKLRDAVERSIAFAMSSKKILEQPLEVRRGVYASDPSVRAFFGAVEQLQEVFSLSPAVREFLSDPEHRHRESFYAGLAMRREEKKVFVPQMVNGVLQQDVPRVVINFTGHRIAIPSAGIEALHEQFIERVYMTLVECALGRLTSIHTRKQELETERALLRTKLRALKARALGMGPLAGGEHLPSRSIPATEARLEAAEQALAETKASAGTLEDYLEQVKDVLAHPEDHVRLQRASSRVTQMGFAASSDSEEAASDVGYVEIEISGQPGFVGRLVHFPREEILPVEQFRPVL